MQTKKINVLIPDGEQGNIRQVLICLSMAGNYNAFLLSDKKRNYMKFSRHCKKFYVADEPGYTEKRVENILEIIEKENIDVLLPTSVPAYQLVLENRHALEKKTNLVLISDKDDYDKTVSKDMFATFCEENKISTPRTLPVNESQIIEKLDDLTFPVVLKPAQGQSGVGIVLFREKEKCAQYITENFKKIKDAYIIQEYIDAKEIDVNVFCVAGKILTYSIQRGIIPPERDFSFSKGIELIYNKRIYNFVKPVFEKLNWNGVAHVDLLYEEATKKIYILEINPRIWGTILGSLRGGINFPDLLIKKSIEPGFCAFPHSYEKIRYAAIGKEALKRVLSKSSPLRFSDTNLWWLISDPLPSVMARYYSWLKGNHWFLKN